MFAVVKLELKKIATKNNALIACLFLLICLAKILPYSQSLDMVLGEEKFGSGLSYWTLMKEEGIKYDGLLTEEQMKKVQTLYNESKEKDFVEGARSEEKELGLKLIYPFQWLAQSLNFPKDIEIQDFSIHMSDQGIENFYQDRLKAIGSWVRASYRSYDRSEVESILRQAGDVKTPLCYAYNEGWRYMGDALHMTFYIFLIYLALALTSLTSADEAQGFTEMDVHAKNGRLSLYLAKVRAAELFAGLAYLAYLFFLLLYHGMIYSLHGADASIEFYAGPAVFNLTTWQGYFLEALSGFGAVLVVVNIILFFSLAFRKSKVSLLVLVLAFFWLQKWANSPQPWANTLAYFTPQNFVQSNFSASKLFVLQNHVYPFTAMACFLSLIYIAISRFGAMMIMNRYYLKGGEGK